MTAVGCEWIYLMTNCSSCESLLTLPLADVLDASLWHFPKANSSSPRRQCGLGGRRREGGGKDYGAGGRERKKREWKRIGREQGEAIPREGRKREGKGRQADKGATTEAKAGPAYLIHGDLHLDPFYTMGKKTKQSTWQRHLRLGAGGWLPLWL